MVELLPVGRGGDDSAAIERAARVLAAGGLVGLPTETVYGLAARADDGAAVARIYAAKGRPAHNPLIVHVPDVAAARALAGEWPDAAEQLARAFWPGPLSLVVARGDGVHPSVAAGGPTVALRAPDAAVTRAVLERLGRPVAAPSANPSQGVSPTTAEHVRDGLGDAVDLILDAGPCPVGIESAVVDVSTNPPRLLRPGSLTLAALRAVVPGLVDARPAAAARGPAPSPGLDRRHYAPRASLSLVASEDLEAALVRAPAPAGALTLADRPGLAAAWHRALGPDPATYARALFAALHAADAAGCASLVVERPPNADSWRAVLDRLERAAAD